MSLLVEQCMALAVTLWDHEVSLSNYDNNPFARKSLLYCVIITRSYVSDTVFYVLGNVKAFFQDNMHGRWNVLLHHRHQLTASSQRGHQLSVRCKNSPGESSSS